MYIQTHIYTYLYHNNQCKKGGLNLKGNGRDLWETGGGDREEGKVVIMLNTKSKVKKKHKQTCDSLK